MGSAKASTEAKLTRPEGQGMINYLTSGINSNCNSNLLGLRDESVVNGFTYMEENAFRMVPKI
jgi:hypothetical protein